MKRKAFKKVVSVVMTAALVAGLAVSVGAAEPTSAEPIDEETDDLLVIADTDDPLSIADATTTDLTVTVDGEEMGVTMYEDEYLANPNSVEQKISIYVPENADADSPIMFYVNNSGWQSDSYSARTKVTDGRAYVSDSDSDKVGVALSRGYVIVSYGCRGRNDAVVDDQYINHSPATMTDTKGAIRYLRYNKDILPAGDTDRIVITGTSGGGALSSVIAASGNSSDYFESLYEIGAAGIEMDADGNYTSIDGVGDDVFAVISYCPITDFRGADQAYEWTYNETRNIVNGYGRYSYSEEDLANSATLAEAYPAYLESLGLTYEGEAVTSENFDDIVAGMMKTEIDLTMEETGETVEELISEIGSVSAGDLDPEYYTWLTDNGDGTYSYDYQKHRTWLALSNTLKIPCAFSNVGFSGSGMNEDNVFGTINDVYSPFEFLSWQLDAVENNVGYDDTGLTWDEYMETEAGQYLSKQIRMSNTLDYLTDLLKEDGDGDAADDGTPAEYWYVRHGMADRDTSFAVEASLFLAIDNNVELGNIKGANTGFAWLRPHSGDYDVQEAYAWLDEVLAEEPEPEPEGNTSMEDAVETNLNVTVDGEAMTVKMYEDTYVANPNSAEQMISIYVPENADANSPIMFYVNNSGWQSDSYSARTKVTDGRAYVSDSDSDKVGVALSRGYVIVSYGCRGRNDAVVDEQYINHSPATMTDTKAAIRYLRYNKDILPAGDTDYIVVTGTSGGGALSTVIAASGNSSDYFESMYEIGAAGIVQNDDGTYTSIDGVGDDVFGVIAYCPITDFRGADMAYEWTFNESRNIMNKAGASTWTEEQLADSATLSAAYPEYLESLGLTYEGEPVTADNFEDIIIGMMEDEMDLTMEENDWTVEDLINDISEPNYPEESVDDITWLTDNGDGTYSYDYQKHRTWLAATTALKIPCAFSNYGFNSGQNEDNLFGTINDVYSPFEFLSWEKDAITNNVGYDDTGLTWDEYMETEAGKYLSKQIRMTSTVDYLTDLLKDDGEGDAADDGTPAEYWYVRHGMADRDTSFSVEASLFLAIDNNVELGNIQGANTGFAWLKPHSGDYDVQEAYAWLDEVLNEEPEPTPADKAILDMLIDLTSELNESDYTEESWAAFQDVLAEAQEVSADPDATQEEVDAALEALGAAIDDLEPIPGTANKTDLNICIALAERLDEDNWTAESWEALQEALDAAREVAADPDATQDEVDAALADLEAAIADLEPAPGGEVDKTELLDEVVAGLMRDEDSYTPESWEPFEEALADALIVLINPDATQDDVDAALEALQDARDGLVAKDGLYKDEDGVWRLYVGGDFAKDFNGFAENQYGKWYVDRGVVTFDTTDILKDKDGHIGDAGTWYYVIDSKVQTGFTGLSNFSNKYGWWYIKDGKVDFTRNSVDKNCNGWWYVVGGKVQFSFIGLANYKNEFGWWYIQNGAVDFNHNGVDKNVNGWWYVKDGKVDFSYNGKASNRYGTWNIVDGKVRFS